MIGINFLIPLVLLKGGGGSSGEVGFADYMENVHRDWLAVAEDGSTALEPVDITVPAVMNTLWDLEGYTSENNPNPYAFLDAYDIDNDIIEMLRTYSNLKGSAGYLNTNEDKSGGALIAQTDWDQILQYVFPRIDNSDAVLSAVDISALVQTLITANVTNATAVALQAITDSKTNTDTIVDGAIQKALEVLNSQPIEDAITLFSNELTTEVNKIKSAFSGGMVDINAVMSSAFIFGNSNIETSRVRSIGTFTNNLISTLYSQVILSYIQTAVGFTAQELNAFNNIFVNNLKGDLTSKMQNRETRDKLVNEHTQLVSQMFFGHISNDMGLVTLGQNAYNAKIVQKNIQAQENVRLNSEEQLWNLKVYTGGANVLSSLNAGGGTLIPDGASQTSLAASGAIAGAVAGAKIGATSGPTNALIGAGIGLVAGGIAGALS